MTEERKPAMRRCRASVTFEFDVEEGADKYDVANDLLMDGDVGWSAAPYTLWVDELKSLADGEAA